MKHPDIKTLLLGLLIALGIPACGGGGGSAASLAGIGGTGITSTGTITGFGSIFVNGVEYQSGSANVTIDGTSANDTALKLGMVVTVKGSIDSSGTRGTADSIMNSAELKGPITAPPLTDPNNMQRKTLTVMGKSVIVDAVSTTFDGNFTFNTIAQNNVVEVNGFIDANGALLATRIEKKGDFSTSTIVEAKGNISAFCPPTIIPCTSFSLDNVLTVNYDPTTLDLASLNILQKLTTGSLVKVKGNYNSSGNTINATKFEAEDTGIPQEDGARVELQGVISQFNSPSTVFLVNGQKVDASQAALKPTNLNLANGITVEVEGSISNGTIIASEIKGREGSIEVRAFVSAVDSTNKILQLEITSGHSVSITVDNNQTQMEDETNQVAPKDLLTDLRTGDHLEIEAYQDNGTLIATHVKRISKTEDTAIKLQGPIEGPLDSSSNFDPTPQTIMILGNTFSIQTSTVFIANEQITSAGMFFNKLTKGAIVKVLDNQDPNLATTGDGIAEEMTTE